MPDITTNQENGKYKFVARYGEAIVRGGIAAIPYALYRYQGELKLTAQQVWFISAILGRKWTTQFPRPSLRKMAKYTGVSEVTLHKIKKELIGPDETHPKWLIVRERKNQRGGKTSNDYDFSPLFDKLVRLLARDAHRNQDFEEDFEEEQDEPVTPPHLNTGLDTHLNPPLHTHLNTSLEHYSESLTSEEERADISKIRKAESEKTGYVNLIPEGNGEASTKSMSEETEQRKPETPPKTQREGSEENQRLSKNRNVEEPKRREANRPVREEMHKLQSKKPSTSGLTSISELLPQQFIPQPVPDDEAYHAIRDFVRDMAGKNHDEASLKSSTTRAYNLYQRAGVSLSYFFNLVYEADKEASRRSTTIKKRTAEGFTNRMAYFFAVLEDRLGLRNNPPPASP